MRSEKRGLVIASRIFLITLILTLTITTLTAIKTSSAALTKENYQLDEKVKLNLEGFGAFKLKLITPSETFAYSGEDESIVFKVEEVGTYRVIVEGSQKSDSVSFIVSDEGEEITVEKDDAVLIDIDNVEILSNTSQNITNTTQPQTNKSAPQGIIQEIIPTKTEEDQITINQPVTQKERISLTKNQKARIRLPPSAEKITINPLNETNKTNQTITNISQLSEMEGEFEIEYITPGPTVKEKTLTERKKEIKVSSPEDVHYTDVLSYTTIPEITNKKDLIKIHWVEENKDLKFKALDTDDNGLLDYVEWIIPHLSNQTFEVSIEILNVKSLPVVGGNWEVEFTTEGTADLTITAYNGTTWTDQHAFEDLKFLRVMCGNEILDYQWINNSVFIPDFSCEDTAYEDSHVITPGAHYLEFDFGGVKAFAENSALDPYDNLTQVYASSYGETITLASAMSVDISQTTLIDGGYSQVPGQTTRIYVNETDWYKVSYACTYLSGVSNRVITEGWVERNGQEIAPSRTSAYTRTTTDDRDEGSVDGTFIVNLTDGDYLELRMQQLKQQSTGNMQTSPDCWMYLQRVRRPVAQLYDGSGGQSYSLPTEITLNLDSETYTNTNAFTSVPASDYIQVDVDGWYKFYYHSCADNGPQGNRQISRMFLRVNGADLTPSDTYGYYRNNGQGDTNCEQGVMLYNLTDGDQVSMRKGKFTSESATTSSTTLINQTWLLMEHIPTQDVLMIYEPSSAQSLVEDANDPITYGTSYHVGSSYQHAPGTSQINFTQSGLYEVSYTFAWDDTVVGGYHEICGWLRRNGTEVIDPSTQCAYSRGDAQAYVNGINANLVVNITAGDYLELIIWPDGGPIDVMGNGTFITVVPLNIFLSQEPPIWLSVQANNTTPSVGENVSFGANWYTPNGLKNWQFFWDLGSGFEPAGSGNFAGSSNESSNITKIIPASMEGQVLNYFFRAYDIDDRQNQTDVRNVTVLDTTPPAISDESLSPQVINYSDFVTLQANITDTTGVDTAIAQITLPDNTISNQTITNISSDIFELNYTSLQIGQYNVTIWANDTGGFGDNSSITHYWNVTGFANLSLISPQGGNYDFGSELNLTCSVFDANLTTAIENYPVTFWANDVEIGTNQTNSSGIALFSWAVSGTSQTTLNCSIESNTTLFYNAHVANDNTTITIDVPNIELASLTHENLQAFQGSAWLNANWEHRKSVTVQASQVSEDLTDFPVLVEIYDTDLRTKSLASANDIIFTASDGTTNLSHEIELFDQNFNATTARLIAWVRTNLSANGNTKIYMYHNNSGATNQEDASGVWSNNYEAVYHMTEASASDSTGNGNDGTQNNGVTNIASGKTDGANYLDGIDDFICVDTAVGTCASGDSNPTFDDAFTERATSTWFRVNQTSPTQMIFEEGGAVNGMNIYVSGERVYVGAWCENCAPAWQGTWHSAPISANTWYHVVNNYNGTGNFEMYLDGVLINSSASGNTMNSHSGDDAIGAQRQASKLHTGDDSSADAHHVNGTIDEFRVSSIQRSSGWITTSFNNQDDPQTFFSLGSEEQNNASFLNEYETTDNIAWVNTTITNNGDAPATNVNVTLNLLYPNGSIVNWFTQTTESCGSLAIGSSCEVQFNNSNSGFDITTDVSGQYSFNVTMNWSGGGANPSQNTSEFTRIHHIPNNFTGYLTDAEIPRNQNTTYVFNFTNPWSSDITNLNVTLNCPTGVTGLACFCNSDPSTQSCYVGDALSLETASIQFNITTTDSTPIGTYNYNVTVEYTNPTNDDKTWTEYENNQLIIRPLLAVIESYPTTIVRGTSSDLDGYAHNIGASPLSNVNITWTLPNEWTNSSGILYNITSSLAADARFYNNITVSVSSLAALGPQTITLDADSPDATQDDDTVTINVTATTAIPTLTINTSEPLRNEVITITATLVYDNATAIANQNITFQNNLSLSALTNASGQAQINYTIPSDAPLGTNNFEIIVNFSGNPSAYILESFNTTNFTITDILPITFWHSPDLVGYGYNISIYTNLTSENPDTAQANVTLPNGSNTLYTMILLNATKNTYEYNFSETWQRGQYNYTIWANNTAGFSNETISQGAFNVESNATILLKTLQDAYIPNEIVNLSDSESQINSLNVQADQGQIIVTGTTNTAALDNTYQLNKSFIVADSQIFGSTATTPNQRYGRMYFSSISNGYSSELTAERGSSTNSMQSTYSVMQADNIDVCHISHTMPAADGDEDVSLASCDVALPTNFDEKCFVSTKHNVEASTTSAGCSEEQRVMANITSTTNLNLQRSSVNCGSSIVEAQVVCFNDETNVTPVHIAGAPLSTGVSSSIPGGPVTEANSWLIYSCQSDGNGIEHANIECFLDNSGADVTCRTSTIGTSESSNQLCVAYAIEFFDAENNAVEHHLPTEVGNVVQFNTTFGTAVDDLNRSLGICVSSFRSGEGSAYARGAYPCHLQSSTEFACGRGQTGNTDPSHDFHCQIIQWPNQSTSFFNPSFFNNTGSTDISAYFLMAVLTNSSGSWEIFETILNDSATGTRRSLNSGTTQDLKSLWNGPGEGSGYDTASNPGGIYQAYTALVDPYGNILLDSLSNDISGNYSFEIDFSPPQVVLDFPENGTINFGTSITVNYTATDPSGVDSCSIFHDLNGPYTLEETKVYVEGQENNFTISGFTQNTLLRWNVRCNDTINNIGFTADDEWFNMIVPPDFTLTSSDIGFQTSGIIEGVNMTINATITNLGGQEGTVNVQFFDGHPDNGTQINGNVSLTISAEGGTELAQVNWSAVIGPHQIYVALDPPIATGGIVEELNETNNIANRSLDINSWQYFFGNVTVDKILASQDISNITFWANESTLSGNIFITDTESSIDWQSLTAIGRTTLGVATTNDFTEIDTLLNMTGFFDSVANRYTIDGNTPIDTTSIFSYKQTINNVPILNSSAQGSFHTGILWDASDSGDNEYNQTEAEDLVFTTEVNQSQPGAYGTYDYEMLIPARLREYDPTDATDVYIYFELN